MRCDECGFENFADAEFCAECGRGIAETPTFGDPASEPDPFEIRFADEPAAPPPPPAPHDPSPNGSEDADAPQPDPARDDFSFEPSPLSRASAPPAAPPPPRTPPVPSLDDSPVFREPSPLAPRDEARSAAPRPSASPAPPPPALEPSPFARFGGQVATVEASGPERKRAGGVCALCTERVDASRLRSIGRAAHCPDCAPYLKVKLPVTREKMARTTSRPAPSSDRWTPPPPLAGAAPGGGFAGSSAPSYAPPDLRSPELRATAPAMPSSAPKRSGLPIVPIVVGVLLVVSAVGLWHVFGRDRIDKMLAAAEDSDDEFELVCRYVAGDSYRYRLDVKLDVLAAGGGHNLEANATIGANLYLDVLDVDADDTGDLQTSFDSIDGSASAKLDGHALPTNDMKPDPDLIFRARYDKRGQLVEEDDYGLTASPIFGQGLAQFPDHKVRVGDTWTQPMNFRSSGNADAGVGRMVDLEIEVTYEVRGVAHHRGRPCVVLEMRGEVEKEVIPGTSVRYELKGALFVDQDKGAIVTGAMDIEGSGSGSEGSVELSITTDLNQL